MKTNNTVIQSKSLNDPRYDNYRKKWKINAEYSILDDYPIHLDVELNTGCNLRCKMCQQSMNKVNAEFMTKRHIDKIVDEARIGHIKSVKLQYRGEPLLDPRLAQVIRQFKGAGVIETLINTNANNLEPWRFVELVEAGLDTLICSVDGYLPSQYNKYRHGGKFDKVVKNITEACNYKKEHNLTKPRIRLQTIDSACDVKKYEQYWSYMGVDEISVNAELDFKDEKASKKKLKWKCEQLWQRLFILYNGEILPCCRAIDKHYNTRMSLGNLDSMSIHEAWNKLILQELRYMHECHQSHEIEMCQRCAVRKYVIKSK